MPGVSVIVPTRDRSDSLTRAVESLLADPAAAEVIVVDDGSVDGTPTRLRELAEREPERLRGARTPGVGPASARARGLELAREPVVLFFEDDLVADTGLVAGHLAHHDRDAGLLVAGYSPIALPPPTERVARLIARLYAHEYERECARWERREADVLSGLYGGHVSMRTAAARAVGVLNVAFGAHYHEDRDFGLRCRAAGLEGHFDRTLRAAHHHRRGLAEFERAAEQLGAGLVHMGELHPATHGEAGAAAPGGTNAAAFDGAAGHAQQLPMPARAVLRASRDVRARTALQLALRSYVRCAPGDAGAPGRTAALKLLRRIALEQGAARARGGA